MRARILPLEGTYLGTEVEICHDGRTSIVEFYTNLGDKPSERWLKMWGKPSHGHIYETESDYLLAETLCLSINT
jgi:hypothetical protein